jgi:hypothetical protein
MLLLCTLNPCTQTVTASNNITFSTHSINAIKSAYGNLEMAMSHCWIASEQDQTLTIYTFWNRHTMLTGLNKIFCTCYVIEMQI